MAVTYTTHPLDVLLDQAKAQKLVLPNFQREFVWTPDAQKRLVASVLTDVPIGSTLILEGVASDYSSQRIGLTEEATPPDECLYLLDGQQRLSCLAAALASPFFLRDPIDWEHTWDLLPSKLRYVWALRLLPTEDEDDVLGYERLSFPDMRTVEPDQLADFLSAFRIQKKDRDNDDAWLHPSWLSRQPLNDQAVNLGKKAREEVTIPLWTLGIESDRRYLDVCLSLIASQRKEELLAQYWSDTTSRPSLFERLKESSPALPPSPQQATEDDIEAAFSDLAASWRSNLADFLRRAHEGPVPAIELTREDLPRAVAIFEVINQGGTPLTAFDLVVARNARDPQAPNLVQELEDVLTSRAIPISDDQLPSTAAVGSSDLWSLSLDDRPLLIDKGDLTSNFKNGFLNTLSLLYGSREEPSGNGHPSTTGQHTVDSDSPHSDRLWSNLEVKHIKRSEILGIPPEGVRRFAEPATEGLMHAWCFLQLRCGVRREADLRYKLMALPLAYCFARWPDIWASKQALNRMEYWYWVSVFGGAYRERQNENAIQDLHWLAEWVIEDGSNKFSHREASVLNVEGYSDRGALLFESPDAAIGSDVGPFINAYTLSRVPKDLLTSDGGPTRLQPWGTTALEDHHIVPLATAATLRESAGELRHKREPHVLNSPMNRTLISREANRRIGGLPPSQYLRELEMASLADHFLPVDITNYDLVSIGGDGAGSRPLLQSRFAQFQSAIMSELGALRDS